MDHFFPSLSRIPRVILYIYIWHKRFNLKGFCILLHCYLVWGIHWSLCAVFCVWLGHPVIPFPQFGSSFATFRPAHCFNDSVRPHSYILPASPSYNQSPGSNSPSPTSKISYWKVCFSFWPFGQLLFALLSSVIKHN